MLIAGGTLLQLRSKVPPMRLAFIGIRARLCAPAGVWTVAVALALALGAGTGHAAAAQAPAPSEPQSTPPAATTPPSQPAVANPPHATPPAEQPTAPAPAPKTEPSKAKDDQVPALNEDVLQKMLAGKMLYLRGGYLDNSLSFDEHGKLVGHSPQGSYTLCLVQVDKVHASKHKVELIGARYGIHFLGALPKEDPTKAIDKVRITPKKKVMRITIDRELVVVPKKKKEKDKKGADSAKGKPALKASDAKTDQASDAEDAKAEMAAAPEAERPADAASITATISQTHANQMLKDAVDKIFADGLDARMIDALPDFWKAYYAAAAAQTDYKPSTAGVFAQSDVDKKAKLLSTFEPPSNEYAQAGGVAGMALYHAVIGVDGKPQEIVVGRPIGFGLDESAADTIRKASFQPAIKDGKPVPVVLDLVVQFRIYSNRTRQAAKTDAEEATAAPKLPGPYSVNHP